MSESGVPKLAITFDTLFEILRNERNKENLSELPGTYYADVAQLLQAKLKTLQNLGSQDEAEHQRMLITNIRKLVTEIYERREKKIISLALNKSRTKSHIVDTSLLLEGELHMYESITTLIDKQRDLILNKILDRIPSQSKRPEINAEPSEKKRSSAEDTIDTSSIKKVASSEDAAQQVVQQNHSNMKTIRFLQSVPKFLGKELEVYGPFMEEDVAHLPMEIAEVLIKKGRAEEMF